MRAMPVLGGRSTPLDRTHLAVLADFWRNWDRIASDTVATMLTRPAETRTTAATPTEARRRKITETGFAQPSSQ